MRFAFIRRHAREYPVRGLCRALEVSPSGYYAWLRRSESRRCRDDRRLTTEIRAVHRASRFTYGSPRIHAELRDRGIACGRHRVARLMRQAGLEGVHRRPFQVTTQSEHLFPLAPNRLDRCFGVPEPDAVWAGDITYLATHEGWLYLAVLLDLCSRRVVGWALSRQLRRGLPIEALEMALARRRPPRGLLHHSDRGGQYASTDYQRILAQHGIDVSMSRRGDCFDNAPVESFFATLKTELAARSTWRTRAQAQREIFEFIELFYNATRRHSALGHLSPADFEKRTI